MNVSVLFNQETFWLSQQRMAELFGVTNADISYHLIQIENNGELHLSDCIKKNLIPSEQWDEQGVTQSSSLLEYSAMARIFVQVSAEPNLFGLCRAQPKMSEENRTFKK